MNLEALQKHIRAVTEVDWLGSTIRIRKLSAQDQLDLFAKLRDAQDKQTAAVEFHVELAARSLATESGDLEDPETVRALLRSVPLADLEDLGGIILRHSGHGNEKKSSAPMNSLPSSSASLSEESSSTPVGSCLS